MRALGMHDENKKRKRSNSSPNYSNIAEFIHYVITNKAQVTFAAF